MIGHQPRPPTGYIESHRTSAKVTIYRKPPLDALLYVFPDTVEIGAAGPDAMTALTSCSTSNHIQQGGQFQIQFRCRRDYDPRDEIDTDNWVDISYFINGVEWVAMRGLIDEVRLDVQVGGSGATVHTGTITGRSWQKAYETTPVWYNAQALENAGQGLVIEAFGVDKILQSPHLNVYNILFPFFAVIGNTGRSNWAMPRGMPGVKETMYETVLWQNSDFSTLVNARSCATGSSMAPDISLWNWAMSFADLQFCEVLTDIFPSGGYEEYRADPDMPQGLTPSDCRMAIVYRDRPYPTVSLDSLGPLALASPYFQLPTHNISRADFISLNTGCSSMEAFNSFITCTALAQNGSNGVMANNYPLWYPRDMQRRGMKRMDASSIYSATRAYGGTDASLAASQRSRLRDWYCLGHEYFQGSIALAHGMPWIKVGSRLVINDTPPTNNYTFYIEGVRHSWSDRGLSTDLDITRGYRGTDGQHLAHLTDVAGRYELGRK